MNLFKRKAKQEPLPPPAPRVTQRRNWPSGLFVSTEKGIYYLKGKSRFKVVSDRAFESWNAKAIDATYESIKHTVFGGYLGFRDGTLITDVSTGKTYLIAGNQRLHITAPEGFTNYGLRKEDSIYVSDKEANMHKDGGVLDGN